MLKLTAESCKSSQSGQISKGPRTTWKSFTGNTEVAVAMEKKRKNIFFSVFIIAIK